MSKSNKSNKAIKEQPKKKSAVREWAETIITAVLLYLAIDFCIGRFRVENISMETTFTEGELVMVNKLNYRFNEPKRGDIVILHSPVEPGKDYIKRLVGLPGDHIVVKNGSLHINGEKIEEPWLHESIGYNGMWDVPEGEYFVLGDNRNHSSDSHVWGSIPKKNLVGNVFFVYFAWPPKNIHIRTVGDEIILNGNGTQTENTK